MTEPEQTRPKVLALYIKGDIPEVFVDACNQIRLADGPAQSDSFAYQFGFLEGVNRPDFGPDYRGLFVEAAKGVGWIVEWKE